jgi:basic amino acid/polyamine antiporter, APA family
MASSAAAPRAFERQATGLVREAGWWDVLVYNLNFISIGLMAAFLFTVTIPFYPGVNVYLNELIAFGLVIPLSMVFAMFAAALPRSGGDYVYVSRTLHPAVGMMSSFNNTVWWFIYGGVPSAFFAQFGLAPLFSTVGQMAGISWMQSFGTWLASDWGTFLAGTALIVLLVAIFARSMHLFFRVQNTLFFVSLISIALIMLIWLFKSKTAILDSLGQGLGPNALRGLGSAAKAAGFSVAPFSLKFTILAGTWIYINLVFNQSSAYIGAEVKRARSLQLWAMPVTAVVCTVYLLVFLGLADKAIGLKTLGQLSASQGLLFTQVAAFGSGSTLIAVLILVPFVFQSYTWLPGQIANASRNFLAYGLDGLMPQWVAKVSERNNTPVNALVLVGAGSIAALAAFVWVPNFATLVGIFGFILGFYLVSIAAIVFPYRLPQVFEASPVKWRVAGIPVVSVLGALSVITLTVMAWAFLTDPSAGLNGHPALIWMNVLIFLSGFVIYYVARAVQRSRGIDISRAFQQLPVE